MAEQTRQTALKSIQANIDRHGHHIYLISGGPCPRYAYTIGFNPARGAELILAGAAVYSADDVRQILNQVAAILGAGNVSHEVRLESDSYGSFSVRQADSSWVGGMMLGALDYYQVVEIPAFQIVPDRAHWTIDIPNMAEPWNATTAPIWQWLHEPWRYPVPSPSVATTNLRALRGNRITEAARWEEDQWELFAGAGPDVPRDEIRVVPLGTLLGADKSLGAVLNLPVGSALWRDADSEWHSWEPK